MKSHIRTFGGFTLVELLVSIVTVAALAAVAFATGSRALRHAADTQELGKLRALGVAMHSWAVDHQGSLPRSSHSAIGMGESGWRREVMPYLGLPDTSRATFEQVKTSHFLMDKGARPLRSPAVNVYFELNPDMDDYEGAPKTWRRLSTIRSPESTILLIMAAGTGDHIMAHFFTGPVFGLPQPREGSDKGAVLWLDGRVSYEFPGSVFDPPRAIDRFHPDKAR